MRILTLDIGGTFVKSAMFEDGIIVETKQTPSVTSEEKNIVKNAAALARSYGNYDLIGAAITGQVDTEKQTIIFQYGVKTDAEGINFQAGRLLEENTNKKVFLLNDSNAAALGEALYGAGKNYRQTILLTYGTGVGGGIVIEGKLFGGERGIAGEVGHMVIHADDETVCGCGHRGCYECYASTTALIRRARQSGFEIQNGRDFFEKLSGDAALEGVLDAWIHEIVEGLCTLTYIFNPPCLVLGGGIMERKDIIEKIRRCFLNRVIPTFSKVDILQAQLGNQAGLYGVYAYVCERIGIKRENE